MVGEIRDLETAESGHPGVAHRPPGALARCTPTTPCRAITRLLDMGVEPFLVASSLEAVLAQRLVRRICKTVQGGIRARSRGSPARLQLEPGREALPRQGLPRLPQHRLRGPNGHLRTAALARRHSRADRPAIIASKLLNAARQKGLILLREDGFDKVRTGVTTIEEVVRATKL